MDDIDLEYDDVDITFPPKRTIIIKAKILKRLREEGMELRKDVEQSIKETVEWK